jgi:curved DNA-binding protein CbpA
MEDGRYEAREPRGGQYSLTWSDRDGRSHSAEARGLDVSPSGLGIECEREFRAGAIVFVESGDGRIEGSCEVVHCTRRGANFQIGLEFRDDAPERPPAAARPNRTEEEPDYYETLQISRKADVQTVHRVYRIMAVRFHPDNPDTGDVEQFLRMKKAYAVLSDPVRRQEYDADLEKGRASGPRPIFTMKDFVTGMEAESNRRLGVLSLLYQQRQTNPEHPGVSLLDLEREMGFPREYLTFTTWYLRSKDFLTVADNSDFALTAAGADYVEKEAMRNEIAGRLLKPGAACGPRKSGERKRRPHLLAGPRE